MIPYIFFHSVVFYIFSPFVLFFFCFLFFFFKYEDVVICFNLVGLCAGGVGIAHTIERIHHNEYMGFENIGK